jgi:translation initiation factor 2B subunit (eIF-2B alpha/beta/delta family)
MLHDTSLFSKVGSATIAALARAVNTLLTATTMACEKFHLTVTIDNEKVLQIAGFLNFPSNNSRRAETSGNESALNEKAGLWTPRRRISSCNFTVMFSL